MLIAVRTAWGYAAISTDTSRLGAKASDWIGEAEDWESKTTDEAGVALEYVRCGRFSLSTVGMHDGRGWDEHIPEEVKAAVGTLVDWLFSHSELRGIRGETNEE